MYLDEALYSNVKGFFYWSNFSVQKSKAKTLEYPIIKEFRLNGRWVYPSEKTIHLLPQQTAFLIQNGKIGLAIEVKVSSKSTEQEGK